MSEYHSLKTLYKDRECLIQALGEMGYSTVEVNDIPQPLVDYHGSQTHYLDPKGDRAEVIVRREYVGGSANDLGFAKQADGTYSAIISEFDSHKHNASWLNGLKKHYTEKVTMKTAKKNGLTFLGKKTVNGRTQLQWLDTRAR